MGRVGWEGDTGSGASCHGNVMWDAWIVKAEIILTFLGSSDVGWYRGRFWLSWNWNDVGWSETSCEKKRLTESIVNVRLKLLKYFIHEGMHECVQNMWNLWDKRVTFEWVFYTFGLMTWWLWFWVNNRELRKVFKSPQNHQISTNP